MGREGVGGRDKAATIIRDCKGIYVVFHIALKETFVNESPFPWLKTWGKRGFLGDFEENGGEHIKGF